MSRLFGSCSLIRDICIVGGSWMTFPTAGICLYPLHFYPPPRPAPRATAALYRHLARARQPSATLLNDSSHHALRAAGCWRGKTLSAARFFTRFTWTAVVRHVLIGMVLPISISTHSLRCSLTPASTTIRPSHYTTSSPFCAHAPTGNGCCPQIRPPGSPATPRVRQ